MNATRKRKRWLLAMAVPSLAAATAMGQIRASEDGHAADASNRVGSGGYNGPGGGGASAVNPNQIIYGNVTGGKAFTGPVNERDPRAFSGPIAGGISDRFIRGSSAAPQPYQPAFNLSDAQPYYGMSRGVAPPLGTVRLGYTGGYLGTELMPQSSTGLSSELSSSLETSTQRLGVSTILGTHSTLIGSEPGELYLQGPLQVANQQTLLAGSPLYGVQSLRPGEAGPSDTGVLSPYGPSAIYPSSLNAPGYQSTEVRRMRAELQGTAQQQQQQGQEPGQPGAGQQQPGAGPQSLGQPIEAPENAALNTGVNASLNTGTLSNSVNTQQSLQQRFTLISPQQQSEQYNQLRQRFERYENPQMAAIRANQQFQLERQAAIANAAGKQPTSQPTNTLGAASMLRLPPPPAPLKVTSLATGVRAKGLHDLLASAEDLMRQNKFQSAIEKYNTAEQVAPNNGLIPLGRANAELGAGYYRQASVDLHRVFLADPALLMGRYDLNSLMPPQRVRFIAKELQDLAANDPKQEMPVFLLAYISYNTDQDAEAARYLQQARQRAGGNDPLLQQLETHWKLPEAGTNPQAPDLNK